MITLLALPTIWLVNRDKDGPSSARPNVAAVGLDPGEVNEPIAAGAPETEFDPMGSPGAMYLESATTLPNNQVVVAVGTSPDDFVATARGTYRRSVSSDVCLFNGLPGGELITVVNVANRRSIECTVSALDGGEVGVVVMSTSRFQRIADLTAAPIHLEIRQ